MFNSKSISFITLILTGITSNVYAGNNHSNVQAPRTFREAKILSKNHVYFDHTKELYCGCNFNWVGESGGRIDFRSCNYSPRNDNERARRIEWEHIVPASWFGRQLQCWQNGGRENCVKNDPKFNLMEADMHNLYPAIGEINGDRSNYRIYVTLDNTSRHYGQCEMKVNFKDRVAEPPDFSKGIVARAHLYMAWRYNIQLSQQQKRLMEDWHRRYPATQWEITRNQRITRIMGCGNPYISRDGLVNCNKL